MRSGCQSAGLALALLGLVAPAARAERMGYSPQELADLPFSPGMVIAVEPIIEIDGKQLHVRIEDTVLVTEDEPVVLVGRGNRPPRGG